MPDYRAVIVENGVETQIRVGTLDDLLRWAEEYMMITGAEMVRFSKIAQEGGE